MIKPKMINIIHKASVIQRWNDHIRPSTGFAEIDKQAHKTFFAYILARCQAEEDKNFDQNALIEGIIFEFLHRVILTDIKPPIYYKIIDMMGNRIDSWVEEQLSSSISCIPGGFAERFHRYFFDAEFCKEEKAIIKTAYKLGRNNTYDL